MTTFKILSPTRSVLNWKLHQSSHPKRVVKQSTFEYRRKSCKLLCLCKSFYSTVSADL